MRRSEDVQAWAATELAEYKPALWAAAGALCRQRWPGRQWLLRRTDVPWRDAVRRHQCGDERGDDLAPR